MTKDRTVIEETSRLLKQIRFSANSPAYIEGTYVAIIVDPRWRDDDGAIEALLTCFSLDAVPVDWEGLQINISRKEGGHSTTWLTFLNAHGQTTRRLPPRGQYSISLPCYKRPNVFHHVIHPPIRARGSAELTHQESPEMLHKPFTQEGQSIEPAIYWRIEETDKRKGRLAVRTTDETVAGRRIVFTLMESVSGRMLSSGKANITLMNEPTSWVRLDSMGDDNILADLVLQPPDPI